MGSPGGKVITQAVARSRQVARSSAVEGRHARQDVVEHRAQAEDVGALVEPIPRAHRLLGRHERRRPARPAAHVEVGVAGNHQGRHLARHGARRSHDRKAPVDQVDLPEGADQDVPRLDVAVEDAAAVGESDRLADLEKSGHHLAERLGETGLPPGARAPVGQRVPLDPFHGEVTVPLAVDADLVHGRDVGVIELRGDLRLADEPLDLARPGRQIGGQDLHGGDSQQPEIADGVDRSHPPGADGGEVLISIRHALARRRLGAGCGRRTVLRLPGNPGHLVAADGRLLPRRAVLRRRPYLIQAAPNRNGRVAASPALLPRAACARSNPDHSRFRYRRDRAAAGARWPFVAHDPRTPGS